MASAEAVLPSLLLRWHDPAARRLPWRTTTDPYAVLVSEVMAQQTQAERAATAWEAFMRRFPTVAALAAAPVGEVIRAWQGLGYNRRAVNLHRCATAVVEHHSGVVPADLDDLLALPGIGPYTARAVLVFAFGADVVAVDTNVARVLARVVGRPLGRAEVQALADSLPQHGLHQHEGPEHEGLTPTGAAVTAALMDLGARTCTARVARCGACPLRAACAWAGGAAPDPAAAGAHRPAPQRPFTGSARQARGRLVDAMRSGPVPEPEALALAGRHGRALLDALVADGLAEPSPCGGFGLPGWSGRSSW